MNSDHQLQQVAESKALHHIESISSSSAMNDGSRGNHNTTDDYRTIRLSSTTAVNTNRNYHSSSSRPRRRMVSGRRALLITLIAFLLTLLYIRGLQKDVDISNEIRNKSSLLMHNNMKTIIDDTNSAGVSSTKNDDDNGAVFNYSIAPPLISSEDLQRYYTSSPVVRHQDTYYTDNDTNDDDDTDDDDIDIDIDIDIMIPSCAQHVYITLQRKDYDNSKTNSNNNNNNEPPPPPLLDCKGLLIRDDIILTTKLCSQY